METLGIVSIIGLVAIIIVKEIIHYKERIELEGLKKANNIDDVLALTNKKEVEVNDIMKEDNLVDLADMPDMPFQERVEGE